jgi:hypothetical protein
VLKIWNEDIDDFRAYNTGNAHADNIVIQNIFEKLKVFCNSHHSIEDISTPYHLGIMNQVSVNFWSKQDASVLVAVFNVNTLTNGQELFIYEPEELKL